MKTLFYNGNFISMADSGSTFSAVGVEGDRIIFTGDLNAAKNIHWEKKQDLNGHLVVPGMSDTHMHGLYSAFLDEELNLFETKSIDEVIDKGKAEYARNKGYVFGMGWNQEFFPGKKFPTKNDMDLIATDVPVLLLRSCAHIGVANSYALDLIKDMQLDSEMLSNIDFSNGLLKESAMRLYKDIVPRRDVNYIKEIFLKLQKKLNSYGLTCIHSDDLPYIPGASWKDIITAYSELEKEGKMTLRVVEQALVYGDENEFQAFCDFTKGRRDNPGLFFKIGPRKLLQDGSLGAKSACMIHGYIDDENAKGIPTYSFDELVNKIKQADENGIDSAVHAIGDATARQVILAFETVMKSSSRENSKHGIVHCQFISPNDIKRMAELNIQAYIQPIFLNSDIPVIPTRIQKEYYHHGYAWKSLIDAGVLVSGGSDYPIEPCEPLKNIYCAVTRKSLSGGDAFQPDEALSVYDALDILTRKAAATMDSLNDIGTIEIGKLADMVVLSDDIFTIPTEQLKDVKVLQTIVAGETVYQG